ncbi:MAG: terminase family protein [Roseiarcus sp.]
MMDDAAEPARARRARPARPRPGLSERIRRAADLVDLNLDTRVRLLEEMTPLECAQLFHDWTFWARDNQAPPPGDWIIWLILAGRGAGKTRAGAEAVRGWVQTYPIVNLIGATLADARDIMVRGESGILASCRRDERPHFFAADLRLEWPNGAVSSLFSAEEPDRLRGKQHMKLWCDELAAWRQPEAFDQAMLGLRLGDKPQAIVTTTPRPSKIIKALADGKDTIVTRGSTFDNRAHLARAFFERITARYKGRAIGRQELFAEIVEEAPGALWTRALLERQRVAPEAAPKEFAEIVVAVDPPARSGSKSDECGLVVAAKAENGLFYVLADLTSQGETPGAWGARVGAAFRGFNANRVVAEINQGGDMVAEVLRQSEPNLPVRAVHATRGKFLRAEPIAAAYERGLVFHVGAFSKLEDQLCALTPDFDRRAMGFSPDRADALVWALADLLGVGRASTGGMYEFWTGGGRETSGQGTG